MPIIKQQRSCKNQRIEFEEGGEAGTPRTQLQRHFRNCWVCQCRNSRWERSEDERVEVVSPRVPRNTQLPASAAACSGMHMLPGPISTCSAPPAFATVHTLQRTPTPYPYHAGKGCSLHPRWRTPFPTALRPMAVLLSLHSLSCACAPRVTSGSQSCRWNCSLYPTAHVTALTLCR